MIRVKRHYRVSLYIVDKIGPHSWKEDHLIESHICDTFTDAITRSEDLTSSFPDQTTYCHIEPVYTCIADHVASYYKAIEGPDCLVKVSREKDQ